MAEYQGISDPNTRYKDANSAEDTISLDRVAKEVIEGGPEVYVKVS